MAKQPLVPFLAGLVIAGTPVVALAQQSFQELSSQVRRSSSEAVTGHPWIYTTEAILTGANTVPNDHFGSSVAVFGDTAIVGVPLDTPNNWNYPEAGTAYVFERSGTAWGPGQKLVASDALSYDNFGFSVCISGDTAVVGAYLDDHPGVGDDQGSAYVFERSGTTWVEQQRLAASDAQSGDRFGSSVAISGDTVVVGAYRDNVGVGQDAGSAYVFVQSGATWVEQQKLTAADGAPLDHFGSGADISGDTVVVAADKSDHPGKPDAGSAYVFVQSGTAWSQQQKLVASDAAAGDTFGRSLAVVGDTVVVGSNRSEQAGSIDAGSAYVFVRSGTTWSEEHELVAPDAAAGDGFGESVDLYGNTAVIGSPNDDHSDGSDLGSAYVFVREGTVWSQQLKITDGHGEENDHFGLCAALSGQTVVVGVPDDDHGSNPDVGSAIVFAFGNALAYCTAGTSASGCQALLSATGSASASAASGFVLQAMDVEGSKDGAFFWGQNGKQANPWGNGTSFQCVIPPVTRGGSLAGSGTVGGCDGSFAQDLNATWCSACPHPQKNPGAGALVQAQLWYRDPLSTSNQTTSLSNAVEFAIGP